MTLSLSLSLWFVQFPSKNSVMLSMTLDQNSFSLSVPSLFSLSIFMGLLVGVLEVLPLLYFPVCGGSEAEMEKETARRREKKRIKEDRERWGWWWWSQRRTGAQGACRRTPGSAVSLFSVWCMDFSSINEICLILSWRTSQRIWFLCQDVSGTMSGLFCLAQIWDWHALWRKWAAVRKEQCLSGDRSTLSSRTNTHGSMRRHIQRKISLLIDCAFIAQETWWSSQISLIEVLTPLFPWVKWK